MIHSRRATATQSEAAGAKSPMNGDLWKPGTELEEHSLVLYVRKKRK